MNNFSQLSNKLSVFMKRLLLLLSHILRSRVGFYHTHNDAHIIITQYHAYYLK